LKPAKPKLSAGVLVYRTRDGVVEVLIAHPGGPFWARKDDGAWSIPKGEYPDGDDPWAAASASLVKSWAAGSGRAARRLRSAQTTEREGGHRLRRPG